MRSYLSGLLAVCLLSPAARAADDEPPDLDADEPKGPAHLVLETGGHTAPVRAALFTRDGNELITVGNDKTIRIWDVKTGERLRVLRPPLGPGIAGLLNAAALSPDGRTLAVAGFGFHDKEKQAHCPIYLVPLAGETRLVPLEGHTHTVVGLVFSPDGKYLASVGDGQDHAVRVWSVSGRKLLHTLHGHTSFPHAVAFSPDSRLLATGAEDGTARIWSVAGGAARQELRQKQGVTSLAWGRDGKTLFTGHRGNGAIREWSVDGKMLRLIDRGQLGDAVGREEGHLQITGLHLTPDGRRALVTWRTVPPDPTLSHKVGGSVLNLAQGRGRDGFARTATGHHPSVGALSPDGRLAVTAGGDNHAVYLWRLEGGEVVHTLRGQGQAPLQAGWGPEGKSVAWSVLPPGPPAPRRSFSGPSTCPAWSLSGCPGRRPPPARGPGLELEGLSLRAARRTADVRRGSSLVTTLEATHQIRCSTLLPGKRAALGNIFYLQLYDALTGKELAARPSGRSFFLSLAPSPDNRYLLAATGDQTLRVYDLDRYNLLLLVFVSGHDWVAWTPQGYYAASPGGERLMGWAVNNGPDRPATFHPASRFRKRLYRPDVLQRLLEAGSVEKALAAADEALGRKAGPVADVAKLLPPTATLTITDRAGLPRTVKVKATAAASAPDQPVVALQLLLDGRPAPGDDYLRAVKKGQPAEAEWSVPLAPGSHHLSVLARSDVSSGASDDLEVAGPPPAEDDKLPALHVLSVGINDYQNGDLKLRYAAPDARRLADLFARRCGQPVFKKVNAPTVLTDAAASKPNVLGALAQLQKTVKPADVVVVFFSGHGLKDEKGGLYLLTAEADLSSPEKLKETCLSGDELRKKLADLPCRVLLLLDACHAAAGVAAFRAFKQGADDLTRALTDEDCGVAVMCAAMAHEPATEAADLGAGYFAHAVQEGLEGKAAPNPHDKLVYVHHLYQHVFDDVQQRSHNKQHPFLNLPWTVQSFPLVQGAARSQ